MMKRLVIFLLLFLPLCPPPTSTAQGAATIDDSATARQVDYGPTIQKITALIGDRMAASKIVGLGIALVDGQKVVWQQGFGYADKAGEVPAAPDTVFELGSISKPLTAIAVMQLAERGKLDINRPVTNYVPEFGIQSRFKGVDASSVTTRLLMTNHSGLPYIAEPITGCSYRPEAMQELPELLRHDWLAFPPNSVYAYSNLGAGLAGLAVEKASGQDFAAYADEHIFTPLGMGRSSFDPKSALEPYLSKSYGFDYDEQPRLYVNYPPAGALLSTASDMTILMRALLAKGRYGANRLLKASSIEKMWTPQNRGAALDYQYRVGLYWLLTDPELKYAGRSVGFAGDTAHQHSRLILLPGRQLGVIVLTNSAMGSSVARTVAVETLKSALEAKEGVSPPPVRTSKPAVMSPKALARHAGLYAGMGGVANLSAEDGHLLVETFSGDSYKLQPLRNGRFAAVDYPPLKDYEFSFESTAGRKLLDQVWLGVKLLPFLTKIDPSAPRQAWIDRLGDYTIEPNLDYYPFYLTIKLAEQNGVLVLIVNGFYYALESVTDTEAVIQGVGIYLGETVRIETKDGAERLIFQNYTFKKSPQ